MVLLYTLLSFATALAVAYVGTSAIIKIAHHRQVYDQPDIRKLHTHPTPSLGGIAIFAGFWIAASLFSGLGAINYLIAATLLIAMIGIVDDILPIRASRKLLIQLTAAGILFYAGFSIEGFYGFMGLEHIHPVLSFGMTLLFLAALTNAYNLIDGIDGLAGSFGTLGALAFGILFAIMGESAWSILSFALAGAIIGFLKFNFYKAKIFMGDTGSTLIGLIIGVLCIQFLNMSYYGAGATQAPLIIAAIIFIPVIDLVRVFITRMSKGNSPFQPDRKHIHHIMLDTAKMSTPLICVTLITFNICLILFAANYTSISLLMGLLVFTCTMMIFILLVKNIGKKEAEKRKHTTHHTLIQMPPHRKTSA